MVVALQHISCMHCNNHLFSLSVYLYLSLLPLLSLSLSLTYTQSLLDEPNPNSPANSQAAQLYQENRREYEKKVLAIVEESWMSVS